MFPLPTHYTSSVKLGTAVRLKEMQKEESTGLDCKSEPENLRGGD